MSATTIWLCGWALGLLALHKASTHDWKNPVTRSWFTELRQFSNQPVGIFAMAVASFMLWWVFVIDAPLRIWRDSRWVPDGGDDDA